VCGFVSLVEFGDWRWFLGIFLRYLACKGGFFRVLERICGFSAFQDFVCERLVLACSWI